MTTYTLAITTDYDLPMLLASCPDSDDIDAAVQKEHAWGHDPEDEPAWRSIDGVTLTDDEPEDESRIVWGPSPERGWLIDENGRTWRYAVREDV
jgi:hypothetical protein